MTHHLGEWLSVIDHLSSSWSNAVRQWNRDRFLAFAIGRFGTGTRSTLGEVFLADLDLSTAVGARTAFERIKNTAERLCFQMGDPSLVDNQLTYRVCVDEALAAAESRFLSSRGIERIAAPARQGLAQTRSCAATARSDRSCPTSEACS